MKPWLRLFLACVFAQLACSAAPTVTVNTSTPAGTVSPRLYGLMTEEINFSYDGGLYGELVRNRAFMNNAGSPDHWSVMNDSGATATRALDANTPLNSQITRSLRVDVTGAGPGKAPGAANEGYWGIPTKPNTHYTGMLYAKAAAGGPSALVVRLMDATNFTVYATTTVTGLSSSWGKFTFSLDTGTMTATSNVKLVVGSETSGTFWLGIVSLFPPTWNDRPNGLRKDLMQMLVDLKPKFLRFPGGNYLEGNTIAERFQWKNTLGPIEERAGHPSPWGYRSTDGMGLLEFLLWCEDMGAEPILGVYAGYSLNKTYIAAGPNLTPYVQDALDEIEYVIGDAATTTWGARRAADGHPEPFPLKYVEIGNEDWFDTSGSYDGRYTQFHDAIKAKYPHLKLISSIGNEQSASLRVKSRVPDVLDEHYYSSTDEYIAMANRFAGYPRNGQEIFVGEWAAHENASVRPWDAASKNLAPTPPLKAAIGDAVWMAGMERNADLVTMHCYAPMLVNVNTGAWQWRPDMIGYNALSAYGSPSYHALWMFSRNVGDTLLTTTSTDTSVHASATQDSATGRLFLKLVNPAASAVSVQLALGNGAWRSTGTALTLAAADTAATNSISAPRALVPVESTLTGVSSSFNYTLPANGIVVLMLDAIPKPSISSQPTPVTVLPGATATLTATVTGADSLQWQKDGVDIPGATGSTLSLTGATSANNGSYALIATNAAGSTTSTAVAVLVTTTIVVDPTQDRVAISPYIYGRNGGLSDNPGAPLSAAQWQFLKDSGVRMLRENAGNNATKYNWKLKLTSHPDWYNNVYAHDWDFAATSLQQNLPGVQGMWAFQLIGKAASSTSANFSDWNYNRSQWWSGVGQNLAGGGTVNPAGGHDALVEGDTSKYLVDWTADDTTGILDHWFRPTSGGAQGNGLGLDRAPVRYWSMDNEPEIWEGTHDDVMPVQCSAEEFMQRYFAVAKKARAKFPEIRLCGPVPANEWQWYNWKGSTVLAADGKRYCWLEYFIKRVGEEQKATGIRLLDVLDIHYYPGSSDPATIVQLHRTFFDRNWVHPEANGVHNVGGSWDNSVNKEYIFGRCEEWLQSHLGKDHGVGLGVSETGIALDSPPVTAVWYASTMGEFMRNGVELFTPWSWQKGMWEVLHLYSRYNYSTSVSATSADETLVSAYATSDEATGNIALVLVNRELTAARDVRVSIAGDALPDGAYDTLRLSNLPSTETFVSHTQNALVAGSVNLTGNTLSTSLPPLSITTVLLRRTADVTPPPPPAAATRLVNLSVRSRSSKGGGVLTMGMVAAGGSDKQVLFRATGPLLAKWGVTDTLADPVLTLFDGNQVITHVNDNWGSSTTAAALLETSNSLGAFAQGDNSPESAMIVSLPAGGHTVEVSDKNKGAGVALGEAFEVDSTTAARLVNVSGRAWVGTDSDELIAGFVIKGPGIKKVLVRAVGPGLAQFSVPGLLADPVLRVFRSGVDMPLYHCDNWGDAAYADTVAATASALRAFEISRDSKDAVLLLELPPGAYTAVVTGLGRTTGVAIVEVYEVE